MLFLTLILGLTTLLLCYAGYVFLIVDKRQEKQILENPEVYESLDDKDYNFDLPIEIDEYEDVRASQPTDKCAAALADLASPPPEAEAALPPTQADAARGAAEARHG